MMDLLLNELSFHGQYIDFATFHEAISRIMVMKKIARSADIQFYSHREILSRPVAPMTQLDQLLQKLPTDQRRSIFQWLARHGPFWEEVALHDRDIYMDFRGDVVTDTAVGEAAFCVSIGLERALVSATPSDWQCHPVCVRVVAEDTAEVSVPNFWEISILEDALREAMPPIASWEQLESRSRKEFQRLTFAIECFSPLSGQPFAAGVATRILARLRILDDLVGSVDAHGKRTTQGHRIYQDHFTGSNALFSDSSESEKHEFEKELTFVGPKGEHLLCTWHGKINHPPFRIHFTWHVSDMVPLYVAYIGIKRTRR